MKKTFTPGPWSIDTRSHSEGVLISDATGVVIADVWYIAPDFDTVTPEVAQANARLIAQAPALCGLARLIARGEKGLSGPAMDLLRAIDGKPDAGGYGSWYEEPDARAAGFTGQEQAKEMGYVSILNASSTLIAPHLPPDVAAALGAAYQLLGQASQNTRAFKMVCDVLERYCNVAD